MGIYRVELCMIMRTYFDGNIEDILLMGEAISSLGSLNRLILARIHGSFRCCLRRIFSLFLFIKLWSGLLKGIPALTLFLRL